MTIGHFHLHKYRMTSTHRGCRFHAKAILELEIDASMTALDVTNEKIGWKPIVSAHGLTATNFQKARGKDDKKCLVWYFARYFNLGGEDPDPNFNRAFRSVSLQSHMFVARVWRRKRKRSLSQRLKGCVAFDLEKKMRSGPSKTGNCRWLFRAKRYGAVGLWHVAEPLNIGLQPSSWNNSCSLWMCWWSHPLSL